MIPAEIASVTVLSKPAKLTYNEGELFDPLGLVLVLNYANPALAPVSLPQDYYTCVPSTPLSATDTTIHIYFRGEDVKIDITVIPEVTVPVTTIPPEPTTDPTDTTEDPTDDTTVPPVVTTDPTVTTPDAPSDDTDESQLSPDVTTVGGNDDGGNPTLVVLWIVILSVIVIALVVLIIYYKRNFT